MSNKNKTKTKIDWASQLTIIQAARERRGFEYVPNNEIDDYTKLLAEARTRLSLPPAPAMPVIGNILSAVVPRGATGNGPVPEVPGGTSMHRDNVSNLGKCSPDYFALVHTPVQCHSQRPWKYQRPKIP